jgi:hypothetical protein
MSVTPSSALNVTGPEGGPFSPLSRQYTLFNYGNETISWEATADETWVSFSDGSGSIEPGFSAEVTAFLDGDVLNALAWSEEPYEALIQFNNLTNECGNQSSRIIVFIEAPSMQVSFEQFDGDFEYPVEALASGSIYKTTSVSGQNRSKFSYYGNTPWNTICCVPISECGGPDYLGKGAVRHIWSGVSVLNVGTGEYSGALVDQIRSRGAWPSSAFIYPSPTEINLTAVNGTEFANKMTAAGAPFMAQRYTEVPVWRDHAYVRTWYTDTVAPNPGWAGQGYFGGGSGGAIWCLGYSARMTFSDPITMEELGKSVARTGDPARTQHIISHNTVTNTFVGDTSRARIRILPQAGRPAVIILYTFLVTPDNGDPPYNIVYSTRYDVPTTGPGIVITEEFPKVVGAVVYSTSIQLLFSLPWDDDFERPDLLVREVTTLTASDNWTEAGDFFVSLPNSETWDNIEGQTAALFVTSMDFGYGWADIGYFSSFDPQQAFDTMESYNIGTLNEAYAGAGFADIGWFSTWDMEQAKDDFELGYEVGELLFVPVFVANPVEFPNSWARAGTNAGEDYSGAFTTIDAEGVAQDDMESYAVGSITTLADGSGWADPGDFTTTA